MNEQLAARYLNPHERRCGIYLIAWFGREQWANSDNRRRRCAAARHSVEATYEQQAHDLSTASELQVRSVVLDCSLPEPRRST
jgi:hypothetical protein